MVLNLSPNQYGLIYNVSFLSLFMSMYAAYRGHYDLAFVPGGVFITSINYWRKPDYSWRRDLDMIKLALAYQLARAYNAENATLYYVVIFSSMCFYPLGIYYYNRDQYWHSVYAHSMLHVGANVANLILYSGVI